MTIISKANKTTLPAIITIAVMFAGLLALVRLATLTSTSGLDLPDGPTLSSDPIPFVGAGIEGANNYRSDDGGQAPALQGVTRLADVAPGLPDAIAWCNINFRTLKADARLSVQQRYDLQDCLYARYVMKQREQDKNIVVRSLWDQASRLDANATDDQLVSAWLHPKAERTAP